MLVPSSYRATTRSPMRSTGRPGESQPDASGAGPVLPRTSRIARYESGCVAGEPAHRIAQAPPRLGAELDARHRHGRERGGGEPRERDVVDAGDRDLTGHVDGELAEASQQSERDEVVEGDDRGGARREHVLGGTVAVLDLRAARDVEHLDPGVPGDELGEPPATEAVGVGLRRAGEVRDARVAERRRGARRACGPHARSRPRARPPGRSRRACSRRRSAPSGRAGLRVAPRACAARRGRAHRIGSGPRRRSPPRRRRVPPCRRRARGSRRARPRDSSPLSTPWNMGFSRSGTTRATVLLRPRTRLRAIWLGE